MNECLLTGILRLFVGPLCLRLQNQIRHENPLQYRELLAHRSNVTSQKIHSFKKYNFLHVNLSKALAVVLGCY
jgi:hypothetical protein